MLYIEIYAVLFFFFSCLQSIASDRRTKGQKKNRAYESGFVMTNYTNLASSSPVLNV